MPHTQKVVSEIAFANHPRRTVTPSLTVASAAAQRLILVSLSLLISAAPGKPIGSKLAATEDFEIFGDDRSIAQPH